MGIRWATGRAARMGHFWVRVRVCSFPSPSVSFTRGASMLYRPSGAVQLTVPESSGWSSALWVIRLVSGQEAKGCPPRSWSPGFTSTVTSQSFSRSRAETSPPSEIKAPERASISRRGRWMPSKILERMPGARVAQMGEPVGSTGSPGRSPVVLSYTWMVVLLSLMEITSPTSRFSPTSTISCIEKSRESRTVTTGPLMEKMTL